MSERKEIYLSCVCLYDLHRDEQSQTYQVLVVLELPDVVAADLVILRIVLFALIEEVENGLLILSLDAEALILYHADQLRQNEVKIEVDVDIAPLRRCFDCILHQIDNDLHQAVGVPHHVPGQISFLVDLAYLLKQGTTLYYSEVLIQVPLQIFIHQNSVEISRILPVQFFKTHVKSQVDVASHCLEVEYLLQLQ